MKNNGTGTIEKEVYLSADKSIKTHLVIELLPEEELPARLRHSVGQVMVCAT